MAFGRPIRVLVVDDAVVVRRVVSEVLATDPDIEVAGTAPSGLIALQKVDQVSPDLVTLDVEMPGMNGLETLKALRRTHPRLPVIMFSAMTERGAAASLEALAVGAADCVTKPAHLGTVEAAVARVRDELVPKVKALCGFAGQSAAVRPCASGPAPAVGAPKATWAAARVDIVTIGVSTGGPNALAAILPTLPRQCPVPIVVVQHMPPLFTKFLAERLNTQSALEIREARHGDVLRPGTVLIAPGDHHLTLEQGGGMIRAALNQDPPEHSCRPAADVLFRSVVQLFGARTLGIILTGMGQDGLRGCQAVKAAGGVVIAQDEASSVVWGMPGFVVRAGLADRVLPVNDIGPEIARRVVQFRGPSPLTRPPEVPCG